MFKREKKINKIDLLLWFVSSQCSAVHFDSSRLGAVRSIRFSADSCYSICLSVQLELVRCLVYARRLFLIAVRIRLQRLFVYVVVARRSPIVLFVDSSRLACRFVYERSLLSDSTHSMKLKLRRYVFLSRARLQVSFGAYNLVVA